MSLSTELQRAKSWLLQQSMRLVRKLEILFTSIITWLSMAVRHWSKKTITMLSNTITTTLQRIKQSLTRMKMAFNLSRVGVCLSLLRKMPLDILESLRSYHFKRKK